MNNGAFVSNKLLFPWFLLSSLPLHRFYILLTFPCICQPAKNWQQLWDNCFFSSPSCRGEKKKGKQEFKETACMKQWGLNHELHIFRWREAVKRKPWGTGEVQHTSMCRVFTMPPEAEFKGNGPVSPCSWQLTQLDATRTTSLRPP